MKMIKLIIGTILLLSAFHVSAEGKVKDIYATPVQLSFFAPVQLAPVTSNVYGLRLTLPYGVNNKVFGLDAGLFSVSNGTQFGLQVAGVFASRKGFSCGLNIAGVVMFSTEKNFGASLAGIYNQADGEITGLQLAGVMAKAKKVTGLQLALITYCDDLTGVQLGLVNICKSSSIPFMLFINAKY